MHNNITTHIEAFLEQLPKSCQTLYVAYSGGMDSSVLLHALWRGLKEGNTNKKLVAVHINHQLSPYAQQWCEHCHAVATQLNIEFISETVRVASKAGSNLEQQARFARYEAFEALIEPQDVLVMGHHNKDQAETFLLRLLRGAGLKGLIAIPKQRTLGKGLLVRPLLSVPKQDIIDYAHRYQLGFVVDQSNEDTRFERNYLRSEVFPHIEHRWPQGIRKINDAAAHLDAAKALLDGYLYSDFQSLQQRKERLGQSIDIIQLHQFDALKQGFLIRYWFETMGYDGPTIDGLRQITQMLNAREDAQPQTKTGSCILCRFGQRLYCLPQLPGVGVPQVLPLQSVNEALALGNGSFLTMRLGFSGLRPSNAYTVCFRKGGERSHPHTRNKSQTLKKLLHEYGLEPWLRDCAPLVYQGDKLVAVGDLWVDKDFYVSGESAWRLTWAFDENALDH